MVRLIRSIPLLSLLVVAALSLTALAETKTLSKSKRKTTITTTTIESEDHSSEEDGSQTPPGEVQTDPVLTTESEITTTFGSTATTGMAGCKTEDLSKGVIKDLKSDCTAWLKDQKSELKTRFVTGVCEESCSDCAMSLRRCSVKGTVRYSDRR